MKNYNSESIEAFNKAIEQGRLSENPNAKNYAGDYMYMGKNNSQRDCFKNIVSREYDV